METIDRRIRMLRDRVGQDEATEAVLAERLITLAAMVSSAESVLEMVKGALQALLDELGSDVVATHIVFTVGEPTSHPS